MSESAEPITRDGYRRLREEYDSLFSVERPALLETIAWAAANGDRSENADYHYGRKRLREIDRRINHLARRLKEVRIVEPAQLPDRSRIRFGARVMLADGENRRLELELVGEDEADATAGRISWNSPLARAIRGAVVGDVRKAQLPAGEREYEVLAIAYPD
ncbi:MAG: GreA/GreB family elongation factor [Sphingosinicella sp.]